MATGTCWRRNGRRISSDHDSSADWAQYVSVQLELLRLGFELVNVPSKRGGKNAADIKMVIDALDTFIINNSTINQILLMSGDSDFTDLVIYLKAHGMYVYGMGIEGTASEVLIRCCDKYTYYDLLHKKEIVSLEPATQPEPKVGGCDVSEARQMLRKVMEMAGPRWVGGGTLKTSCRA